MKYSPRILRSAMEEWSDWLETPDTYPSFTVADMRRWVADRPPVSAFSSLIEIISVMQDEIDLLNIKLAETNEDLQEARRYLTKRF